MTTLPASMILKRDALGRVTVTPARRAELLDEFERSGMKGVPFAKLVGVNYQTFASWIQKRRRERGDYPSEAPAVATEIAETAGCSEGVTCNEVKVLEPSDTAKPIAVCAGCVDVPRLDCAGNAVATPPSLRPATSTEIHPPPARSSKSASVRQAMNMRFMELLPPPDPPRPHEAQGDALHPMEVVLPGGARLMLCGAYHVDIAVKLITALHSPC
jgi:hypothetical protein